MLNISYQGSFLYCPHKMGQFTQPEGFFAHLNTQNLFIR